VEINDEGMKKYAITGILFLNNKQISIFKKNKIILL
jgi:hypothetical protein